MKRKYVFVSVIKFDMMKSRDFDETTPTSTQVGAPTRKTTIKIRRTAVRETGVSQHHGGPTEPPLKLLEHHSTILYREF